MLDDVKNIIDSGLFSLRKNSPAILIGFGVAGIAVTAALAVKATPKALELIEEERKIKEENNEELTKMDIVKKTWTLYVPSVCVGVLSAACIVSSHKINTRRNIAIATAYKISESAYREFKDKTMKVVGKEKYNEIREEVAKEKVEKANLDNRECIITEPSSDIKCYDSVGGVLFKSTVDKINKAINELNRKMLLENYVSLNDFYSFLNLPPTPMGNELGWKIDKGYLEVSYYAELDSDNNPYIVIDYSLAPEYEYYKFA